MNQIAVQAVKITMSIISLKIQNRLITKEALHEN